MKKDDLSETSLAILAGGLGTRLRSVVADRPKVMGEVAGRPFLAWVFDWLLTFGARHVVICSGYLGSHISDFFGHRYRELDLDYSLEKSPLGTGGAVRLALPLMGSNPFLVLNGDSFCDVDLCQLRRSHAQNGAKATLVLTKVEDASRYGTVKFDSDDKITAFLEKQAGSGWINAGIYVLDARLLHGLPVDQPFSIEKDLFPKWLAAGMSVHRSEGTFIDIGTPASFAQASRLFVNAS